MAYRICTIILLALLCPTLNAQQFGSTTNRVITDDLSECFDSEFENIRDIDGEDSCFEPDFTFGETNCFQNTNYRFYTCFEFEPFQATCAPITITSVEFIISGSSSEGCHLPLSWSIENAEGETIHWGDVGEGTETTSVTFSDNFSEVFEYQVCISYWYCPELEIDCTHCIDGIERKVNYECGGTETCCTPKEIKVIPEGPIFVQEGEVPPACFS